jgi:SAM-dependent methyltransferase
MLIQPQKKPTTSYDPTVFDVVTVAQAQDIILTPEGGQTSSERWRKEAPHLIDIIKSKSAVMHGNLVLDYGCGIGRLSLPLIADLGCFVVGVDISTNMRALATSCVDSQNFVTLHPAGLWLMQQNFDAAIAVWTLQHVFDLDEAIEDIKACLRPGGRLFVVNNVHRVVPTKAGWADDEISVRATLGCQFNVLEEGVLDAAVVPPDLVPLTFWGIYERK